jgi:hypothetical protein
MATDLHMTVGAAITSTLVTPFYARQNVAQKSHLISSHVLQNKTTTTAASMTHDKPDDQKCFFCKDCTHW